MSSSKKSKRSVSFFKRPLAWLITLAAALLGFLLLKKKSVALIQPILQSEFSALANWWLAVAKFETANFTSGLYLDYGNPWGMNCVQMRPTTQIGCTAAIYEGMSKGIYTNDTEAGQDIVEYMRYFNYPTTFYDLAQFIAFMKSKGYFGADYQTYYNGVISWV